MPYASYATTGTLTIAEDDDTSDALDARGFNLAGLVTPDALTGASVSFLVSVDGTAFVPLYTDANELYSVPVAASRAYSLDMSLLAGWRYVKVVSDATEAAERVLSIVTRQL